MGKRRQGGFLLSVAFHLFVVLLLTLAPDILAPDESDSAEVAEEPERLVLFLEEPKPEVSPPATGPEALLLLEEPPQDRLIIPKATRPAPADKQPEFQNDLPFSEGNTDEFVTDEETNDPGEEGDPGEKALENETDEGAAEEGLPDGAETEASKSRLADLLPRDPTFSYSGEDPDVPSPSQRGLPPAPRPPADIGEGGQGGENGTFEDIRRFLLDKRFHNPEGGLVTGLGRTLYYNDKGADFVPWIRRMLAEVRRNFMMPYSASFLAGHVAVGVVVNQNGDLTELTLIIPSGTAGFDNAAIGSLRAADLLPLPSDYPDDRFEFILVFWINEQPYELF